MINQYIYTIYNNIADTQHTLYTWTDLNCNITQKNLQKCRHTTYQLYIYIYLFYTVFCTLHCCSVKQKDLFGLFSNSSLPNRSLCMCLGLFHRTCMTYTVCTGFLLSLIIRIHAVCKRVRVSLCTPTPYKTATLFLLEHIGNKE